LWDLKNKEIFTEYIPHHVHCRFVNVSVGLKHGGSTEGNLVWPYPGGIPQWNIEGIENATKNLQSEIYGSTTGINFVTSGKIKTFRLISEREWHSDAQYNKELRTNLIVNGQDYC
jgi:hypothetical protein